MDDSIPALRFPSLYRAVLDAVAELERTGERPVASRVRSAAMRAYAGAWDARGLRRLTKLQRDADRALERGRAHAPARLHPSPEAD